MPTQTRLLDLLVRLQELHQDGNPVRPEEVCGDRPELLEPLKQQIRALGSLANFLGLDDAQPPTGSYASPSVLHALAPALPPGPRVQLPQAVEDGASERVKPPASSATPDRYQLLGEIARGGMGAVLKGHDVDLGRDIAVKLILESHTRRPELLERFIEEARIAGQLQHPGIVPIYELGQFPDQRLYFTMKLVRGQTLATLLSERPLPADDRPRYLKIFEQICQTLAYAHARGVIHRDLKPANVMVGAFGEVQVMDWGLAKVLRRSGVSEGDAIGLSGKPAVDNRDLDLNNLRPPDSHTADGAVLGTPAYMAPEQARGETHNLDERCDVFGLGAILCEILTGRPPYIRTENAQVYHQAVRADLADALARLDASGTDIELIQLAKRSLAPERHDRPRTAGVLASELSAYLNSVEQRLRQAELAGVEAKARAEEERRRREVTVAAQKEMQRALTRQVAERLQGELGNLEIVVISLAGMVEQRADWTEAELVGWMDAMLRRDERIFGLCLAFEPGQFRGEQEDYGLYQFRGGPGGEIATKHLLPPAYPYRELDWYKTARAKGHALWTEPFVDREGGDIPIVCYTVPFRRQGRIIGVATLDLSVKYFQRLGGWLRELDFGQESYGIVISRCGVFISHPDPEYDFASLAAIDRPPRNITDLVGAPDVLGSLSREEHVRRWSRVDPITRRPATWLSARVQPAGWTFVAVIKEALDSLPT